jgi:hypothetical protein
MIVAAVMITIVIAEPTLATRIFQLLTASVRLPAVFPITMDRLAHSFFGLVNASLAAFVGIVGAQGN